MRFAITSELRGFLRTCSSLQDARASLPAALAADWQQHVFVCDHGPWQSVASLPARLRAALV